MESGVVIMPPFSLEAILLMAVRVFLSASFPPMPAISDTLRTRAVSLAQSAGSPVAMSAIASRISLTCGLNSFLRSDSRSALSDSSDRIRSISGSGETVTRLMFLRMSYPSSRDSTSFSMA